jgi:dTDP-4-amino-4,6-dideoxygalactose transaminase
VTPGGAAQRRPEGAATVGEIPLAKPDVGEREEELVLEVLRSGRLSLGPMLERFEQDFAAWLGVEDAVAVSSGTAALHLGVRAMEWGRGDEVVTSPFSFIASANCLLYEGAVPVFCDIDPVTLNIDPDAAAAACGERTVGLLPVHVFGRSANMPALESLAARRGLGIVEDACESAGAVDGEGVRVGARGNIATFAFYANKQLFTGEGGMITAGDPSILRRARSERNQGRGDDMSWIAHDRLGFNYRLSDLAAAIGVAQLERADRILAERSRVASLYRERLSHLEAVRLPSATERLERRSWFVYVLELADGIDRDAVIDRLAERGIASKAYLPCIHLQPFYRGRFGFKGGEFPVAERASSRSLALPFFTSMTEEQVERVCDALAESLGA